MMTTKGVSFLTKIAATIILTWSFTYINVVFIPNTAYETKHVLEKSKQETQIVQSVKEKLADSGTSKSQLLNFMRKHNLRSINPEELKSANTPQKCYIAYKGIVYDVSQHPMWKGCKHNGYSGGIDATGLFPHPITYLNSVKIVGVLSTYLDSLSMKGKMELMQHAIQQPKLPLYTYQEVRKHRNYRSCWVIVDGYVYDVTRFISRHPGGSEILEGCGRDISGLFSAGIHNQQGRAYLKTFKIGKVKNYQPPRYRYYNDD